VPVCSVVLPPEDIIPPSPDTEASSPDIIPPSPQVPSNYIRRSVSEASVISRSVGQIVDNTESD